MPLETIHVPVVVHSVLYRELCAGGHVVENRLIIHPEKANLYRTGSIFTEMSFLNGELTESDYITADGDINIKSNGHCFISLKYMMTVFVLN